MEDFLSQFDPPEAAALADCYVADSSLPPAAPAHPPSASSGPAAPDDCLGAEALARLRQLGQGGPFLREMIEIFLRDAPGKLAAARSGLQASDLQAVLDAVHNLKSTASHVGARHVRDLCVQIEGQAANRPVAN